MEVGPILKWLIGLAFGFILISSIASVSYADENNRLVRVGVYDNYPKIFRDNNGKESGLFADILNFIAIQENWTIDYVYGSFAQGLSRLENGDIDIMVDVAYSEERAKIYDFTNETVLGSWGVVYVKKGSTIDTFQDLNNTKVGILEKSVYLQGTQGIKAYIDSFGINVDLVEVKEYPELFNMLSKGEIDAAIVSRIFGMTNEKKYPDLKATDIFFDPTELRFALHKNAPDNPYLIEKLDYWLKQIKEGYRDFYQDSLKKYGLYGLTTQKEVIPSWVWWTGGIIMGALLISLLNTILLRHARKIIAKKLREKEFLLSHVVNEAPMFIASCNDHGIITLFEGSRMGLTGLSPEKVIGKSAFEVFKDDINTINQLKVALAGRSVEFKSELGGYTWLTTFTPIKDKDHVVSVAATSFDYSEAGKLEKIKSEFVNLASHHLRTPSTQIKWAQELLWPVLSKCLNDTDQALWQNISKANSSIIHLADILTYSSWLELTSFTTTLEAVNINDLVREEVEKFKDLIEEKKLDISVDAQVIPELSLDRKKIEVIVSSLISNAVHYSFNNGYIKVKLEYQDGKLKIMVQDNGWGIPSNQQDKIFQKFYRADNAAKNDAYGIGMSLYICKTIIDKMGGRIWFESKLDHGSSFTVELPASKEV